MTTTTHSHKRWAGKGGHVNGDLHQLKLCGTKKVGALFGLDVIAYNLIQLGNLLKQAMAAA